MTVFLPDNRRVIQPTDSDFNKFPLPAVTAIDTTIDLNPGGDMELEAGFGSGVVISPNFVLSAAHNFYPEDEARKGNGRNQDEIRVSNSINQLRLNSREIGHPNDIEDLDVNVIPDDNIGIFYPTNWRSTLDVEDDIAFVKTVNNALISPSSFAGLIAFVDPKTAEDYTIQTAGYPIDNVSSNIPGNSGQETRDLVLAPESFAQLGRIEIVAGRRMQYSKNIDTISGQSGSPVWHTLEGDDTPRVLGVHSTGGDAGNFGALITKDVYDIIMDQIEEDENPNLLPENAIIGSDPSFLGLIGGNDQIIGTYRQERIIGKKGNDIIFGEGADDRLEGEEGNDKLEGGAGDDQLDGGTNLPIIDPLSSFIENDVAVFSGNISEYEISTDTSGGFLGTPIGEEAITTITHLNGGIDGTDTLTNIEILKFADVAVPLSSDDGIIDGLLNFFGGSGNDDIVGNILANLLRGNGGNDRLSGDDGDDTLKGNGGNDKLYGEDDNDLLQGFMGSDILEGGAGNDRLYGNEGSDIFRGGSGNDTLSGGAGFGRDKLKGQDGNDLIAGGGGNDLLQGGKNNDTLFGNGNNDILFGDDGNDRLNGGSGVDTLSGGAGQDEFVFVSSSQSQDEIRDFNIKDDTLLFQANKFPGISILGTIRLDMLTIGSSANDSSDRFIYNSGTGDLFFDSDGTGSAQQTKLAKLDAGLALTSSDFEMF